MDKLEEIEKNVRDLVSGFVLLYISALTSLGTISF
jgi:hypothetical protein